MPAPSLIRIVELRALVAHHNRLYHELDAPELLDGDFDALARQLRALEAEYPELAADDSPTGDVRWRQMSRLRRSHTPCR